MIGADALVPPTVTHAPMKRTFTPVSGSATAETSATVRFAQPVSVCQAGLGSKALQPLPAPDHADSVQPRAVEGLRVSDVPPTAVRNGEDAGYGGGRAYAPGRACGALVLLPMSPCGCDAPADIIPPVAQGKIGANTPGPDPRSTAPPNTPPPHPHTPPHPPRSSPEFAVSVAPRPFPPAGAL